LQGIPEGSRASKEHGFLRPQHITDDKIAKVRQLNEIAQQRGQTLAQMALAWLLKDERLTSVLIGTSRVEQIDDCVKALDNLSFSKEELDKIEKILK
jgi:L-glyceraldehyde 3-phosphate reductase